MVAMRKPDVSGVAGDGWIIDSPNPLVPRAWLLRCPDQHPFWVHFHLAVIDLKGPAEDGSMANLEFPDARWEYGVFALDVEPEPDPDEPAKTFVHLTPQNVLVQVPDHPLPMIVRVVDKCAQAAVGGVVRVEPFGVDDLHPIWRHWIEGTLEHPFHERD